jgi:acyl transferase domain-containing protein/acyl carrier protein
MTNPPSELGSEGIAIIGMSGRFPGAKDLEEYWRNLRDGVESISFFSADDLVAAGEDPSLLDTPNYVNAGGVLDDIDLFDASFFGFSARDSELMDPQQRVFLECSWHALENAGYNPDRYRGLIGVFAGTAISTYLSEIYANLASPGLVDDFQIIVGNDKDHLTTQASYKLNLKGPSVAVQAACSTSLVAVCMSCQSLLDYHCDMALAGGVAINMSQSKGYFYQPGGIFSPDGHCRPFDAKGRGIVVGNGAGIVVLKRLSDAIADRDHIRAVIRGFALNNDGSAKVGYTAPSVEGQAQVIAMAQAMAGVSAESISYIEAHGTATALGDPVEIAALTQAFRASTKKNGFCAIGSVKSNIGHLDTAAGVAGLIKTVLALEHRQLPPSLNYVKPNPEIDFSRTPFRVNARLSEWRSSGPRRAGVSSFGIGGTNAHVVLEQAPETQSSTSSRRQHLLVLSSKTASALETATDNLAAFLAQQESASLPDVAYSLQVGRKFFGYRRALVSSDDPQGAAQALGARDRRLVLNSGGFAKERPLVFMFPGQGTQCINMARRAYDDEPLFREQFDRCARLLLPHLGFDFSSLIYPAGEPGEESEKVLARTSITQPALFAVEFALARFWISWGLKPQAMIGHSLGEYVAACLAGVFSLEDALALVAIRGKLMESMSVGAMLAVGLPESEARLLLNDDLSLAAVNGKASSVVSGSEAAVCALEQELHAKGSFCRRLVTSHAFHCRMMEPIVDLFVERVRNLRLNAPEVPYISNLTGTWISAEEATRPEYWGEHLRNTVRFGDGIEELRKDEWVYLEVGPGETLSMLVRNTLGTGASNHVVTSFPAIGDPRAGSLLATLGWLWVSGVDVNLGSLYAHENRRRVALPVYPFERQRYWIPSAADLSKHAERVVPSASQQVEDWFYLPGWKQAGPGDPARHAKEPSQPGPCVIFDEGRGLGAGLAERLLKEGTIVTRVVAGEKFALIDSQVYSIRPDRPEDYRTLMEKIEFDSVSPPTIFHLWSADTERANGLSESFERTQSRGFYSLAFLACALRRQSINNTIRISVVTTGVQEVLREDCLSPAKATVLAACKVIPQEQTNILCQNIDIAADDVRSERREGLLDLLIAELIMEPLEPVIALRRGRRWTPTFESIYLSNTEGRCTRLRTGGVYLITGGLGNIGLIVAQYLAHEVRPKLVLVGRSAFPETAEWEPILKRDPESSVSRKIRILMELEKAGAEIMLAAADCGNRDEMELVVAEARRRFGNIQGVFHCAGNVAADSAVAIDQIDRSSAQQHFRSKIDGVCVLDELFRGQEIDFFVLFSSLAAVLGGLGLAPYAAGNVFLDAFARLQSRSGSVPWISVNWDAWEFDTDSASYAPKTTDAIDPDQGISALRMILERAPEQIIVSSSDLQSRLDDWVNLNSLRDPATSENVAPAQVHPRPELMDDFVSPDTDTERTTVQIWENLLGVSPIGVNDSFFELGGHSLMAIQFASRLREAFGVEFPIQKLFEAPRVSAVANWIDHHLGEARSDHDGMIRMLELVESLPPEDVKTLLESDDVSIERAEESDRFRAAG